MIFNNKFSCVIVLTEKAVEIKINGTLLFTLPENQLSIIPCYNNDIDFSHLDTVIVIHVDRTILNDYLLFINKDLTGIRPWPRMTFPVLTCGCRAPHIFKYAVLLNNLKIKKSCEAEQYKYLLFTVLSLFLQHSEFISLVLFMLRNSVKDSVCNIIKSDIHKKWSLSLVASALCVSPSLLKKKLKNEGTSYSQIVTDCRMSYAAMMLMTTEKSIVHISQLCGYPSTSYFISIFKTYYGVTPKHYAVHHSK